MKGMPNVRMSVCPCTSTSCWRYTFSVVTLCTDHGDTHPSLDPLKDASIKASSLRLRFEFGGELADCTVRTIDGNPKVIVIQDRDVVAAALAQFRKRPSIGFSDCLLVEIARKAGHSPLGAFDLQLAKLEGAIRV